MCGIVGFLSRQHFKSLSGCLESASEHLMHRGPDDAGQFEDAAAGVGLAHRRLAVIDLTPNARQPMSNDSGSMVVVYNGEIYNYRQIRTRLAKLGHCFASESDTEVALKAYEQWGTGCFDAFVGMFALAIWDAGKQQLVLGRDRLGIKPLYFHAGDGCFLFASELKALSAFDEFSPAVDLEAFALYLHYQYVPGPRTIFKDTFKLFPGQYCVVSGRQGRGVETDRFWTLPAHPPDLRIDEDDALTRLDERLTQAVSDRMISDVPLGALLSGGIDSSLIVAMMQKVSSTPVQTFSVGFEEAGYDESVWAGKIAKYLGTDHHPFVVTPAETQAVVPAIPEVYDEPFADVSAIPTLLVAKLARSKVTVALSGDGGDEQFAGYVRYWMTLSMMRGMRFLPASFGGILKKIPPSMLWRLYRPWIRFLPQRFRIENFHDKWEKYLQVLGQRELEALYRMTVCLWTSAEVERLSGLGVPESEYDHEFARNRGLSPLSRMMRVDLKTYLSDAMLAKVDRAGMACGLEVRVPFLDHRVVEFTLGLSDDLKYRNGTGKYLLKKLLRRYLPSELFERPKMGFGVPMGAWFRRELKPMLLDYLSPDRLRRTGWLDPTYVQEVIAEHMSGRVNHQYRLWSLLVWEMWAERWMQNG